jgi:hypothetical protein
VGVVRKVDAPRSVSLAQVLRHRHSATGGSRHRMPESRLDARLCSSIVLNDGRHTAGRTRVPRIRNDRVGAFVLVAIILRGAHDDKQPRHSRIKRSMRLSISAFTTAALSVVPSINAGDASPLAVDLDPSPCGSRKPTSWRCCGRF